MKPRFPLSHRARHQKQRDDEGEKRIKKERGLRAAIIIKTRSPTPHFLVDATPQF